LAHSRRLPKSARLNDSKAFARLLRGRRRVVDCLELALDRTDTDCARLGIVVGKKQLPRAVDRNALKRIVRETFRHRRDSLPPRELLIRLRSPLKGETRQDWRKRVGIAVAALLAEAVR
jgi:ribonuclease P protein component